jgi:hypothetical protein
MAIAADVVAAARLDQSAPVVPLIEYYNPDLDHYFITANVTEVSNLDSGVPPGWLRTGAIFAAWSPTVTISDTAPVCRFYSRPEALVNSHFYSASTDECAYVLSALSSSWQLESNDVFRMALPDVATGLCGNGTTPIFRLFNNRKDANHRYTADTATRDGMVAIGFLAEGYVAMATSLCAPTSGTFSKPTQGATAPAGLPKVGRFLPLAPDPRGGDNAYNTFKRLPDGRGITFGGFSHDRAGNNSVAVYDPRSNSWQIVVSHTPWIDGPVINGLQQVTGRPYLGNRDNHNTLVVGTQFWVLTGARGVDLNGNWTGRLNLTTWNWSIDDDSTRFGDLARALPSWINSAAGVVPETGVAYIFGGARQDNPWDGLVRVDNAGNVSEWSNIWGSPAFAGAEKLRYVSNSHFVRAGKVQVYGGGHESRNNVLTPGFTLYEIDLESPRMSVRSVNTLPAEHRVQGEAIFAYYVEPKDMMVATDGRRVNIYDYARNAWYDVPVTGAADPERRDYGAGFYAPEVDMGIVMYRHGHVYGLRLDENEAAANPEVPVATPTPIPSQPNAPIFLPPGGVPAQGSLALSATAVRYAGPSVVLGSSKHLDFANVGGRWYKGMGDHAGTDTPISSPMQSQDGRQEIYSFNVSANDWRQDFPYYDPDPAHVQQAFPDDGFVIARGDEMFSFAGVTANPLPAIQPPGVAKQLFGRIMAWRAPSGPWRDVARLPNAIRSDRAWRGIYDPATDRFVVPARSANGLAWVVLDAKTGTDLTQYASPGTPVSYGQLDLSVAGMAVDFSKRTGWLYDHTTARLYSVSLDDLRVPTFVASIPEPPVGGQAAVKIAWHPGIRAVVVAGARLHAYEVDRGTLTTWPRPDGFTNKTGKYVPTSTIFFDTGTTDIVSIGGIDWDSSVWSPVYWRLVIR